MIFIKMRQHALAALFLTLGGAAPPAVAQALSPTGVTRPKPFVWCDSSLPATASNWSQCDPGSAGADFSVLNDLSGRDIYGQSVGPKGKIVKDVGALVRLGKALFWEQDVGSDGNACASCHFHAGADTRLTNQLTPGFKDSNFGPGGDVKFGSQRSDTRQVALGAMPSGAVADSNYTLKAADFPLHKLQNEADRDSPIVTTTNDRVSSQGAFDALYTSVKRHGDKCSPPSPSIFHAGTSAARQVEPRNTPSMIDTVFQQRNFWDSRANNLFNGVGVFGMRDILGDPNARLLVFDANGNPRTDFLMIEDASLASQAMGPPLSALEMSCSGRNLRDVGRKMVAIAALKGQFVARDDSVLGPVANTGLKGLKMRYRQMIQGAFQDQWWNRPGRYAISGGAWTPNTAGYTQMEANFSMFWGLAILAYESTLVSAPLANAPLTADSSEFDRRQARGISSNGSPIPGGLAMQVAFGGPTPGFCTVVPANGATLTADEELLQRGCTIFARNSAVQGADGISGGGCFVCHNAQGGGVARNPRPGPDGVTRSTHPLLTEGTTSLQNETFNLFLTVPDAGVRDANGAVIRPSRADLRDNGTAGIGLRPVLSDLMMGAADPYKNPLSLGRQLENYYRALDAADPSPLSKILDPKLKRAVLASAVPARAQYNGKLEVDGATKVPLLRNIALTPPYFSWGGYPSLRQMLKVYNRGMNSRTIPYKNVTPPNPVNNNNGTETGAIASNCASGDNSGTGVNGYPPLDPATGNPLPGLTGECDTNITAAIRPLGLVDCENPGACPVTRGAVTISDAANDDLAALERFLLSLTDRRVQCSKAPFDHPSLIITEGHVPAYNPGKPAPDITFELPAVGAGGYPIRSGYCIPGDASANAPGRIPPEASIGLFTAGMQATSGGAKAPSLRTPVGPTP